MVIQKKKIIIKNDIIGKTIKFFDKKYSTKTSLSVKVIKFIPIGYGLGGGSSNASVVLKYLYSLHSIADSNYDYDSHIIGSDVSLFRNNLPKQIDGIASVKNTIKLKCSWKNIYLLLPSKRNPTKKIFSLYKNNNNKYFSFQNMTNNELIVPAMNYNKEMKEIILLLNKNYNLFLKYGMTGSGSGIFIIFRDNSNNRSFFHEFKSLFPLASIEKSEYFS
jgi:4-diphosphocytidyl-2-C-methyl-D-erythritol kinase